LELRNCREARGRCQDLERRLRDDREASQRRFDADVRACRERGRGERGRGERGRGRGRGRGDDSCAWLEENQRASRDAWQRELEARLRACREAGWRCQDLEREQHTSIDELHRLDQDRSHDRR